jgi:Fungal specific transcription factor domain
MKTGETGNFFSDQHYEAALQNMDYILMFRDTRSVSYLLLLAIYCLRSPRDPGAWNFARLAMTPCIELGLHRRPNYRERTIKYELGKRLFWSCYYLDREVSMALGRPPAISDSDIDVELPLDIDEQISDPSIIHTASRSISDAPATPATSLTSFIHHLRLKRIESEIQSTIYRVSFPTPTDPSIVRAFLERLSAWESMLPGESRHFEDSKLQPYDGIEAYVSSLSREHHMAHFLCTLTLRRW